MHTLTNERFKGERNVYSRSSKKSIRESKCFKKSNVEKKCLNVVVIPTSEIMPLDGVILENSQRRFHNWNPTPEDLMADDWETVKL